MIFFQLLDFLWTPSAFSHIDSSIFTFSFYAIFLFLFYNLHLWHLCLLLMSFIHCRPRILLFFPFSLDNSSNVLTSCHSFSRSCKAISLMHVLITFLGKYSLCSNLPILFLFILSHPEVHLKIVNNLHLFWKPLIMTFLDLFYFYSHPWMLHSYTWVPVSSFHLPPPLLWQVLYHLHRDVFFVIKVSHEYLLTLFPPMNLVKTKKQKPVKLYLWGQSHSCLNFSLFIE